jgi:hypothetical protein
MMRETHRLARRGRVGLGAAYVVRLGDRLIHLPAAFAALRRARRLLRDGA